MRNRFIMLCSLLCISTLLLCCSWPVCAQQEEETANGIVSLAGREGFTIASKNGDFVFKPYMLVQTGLHLNWYDDEGLDKAYNQDNIANSGFSIPYAVLGFTGKAFGKVAFNLSINAAASGGALLHHRLYLAAEAYWLHVGFTERQKIDESYDFLGGYLQGGYFITPRLQAALRYDLFNRNGTSKDGMLNMPAVGFNYFFSNCNLKLQAMYQYIARSGHATQLDRDNDNLGLATHGGTILLQYTF